MKRMSGLDASFLYMETPTMHMHVVGVVLLEPVDDAKPASFDDVVTALGERIHLMPPLRRRMVAPPGAIDHPMWIEDPDFDLQAHLFSPGIESPVSWSRLEEFVGEMSGRPLDRDRPLWEMGIVEGVEGGSTAIVTKLHHSMMDGGAGYDLMASIFDLAVDAPPPPPGEPWVPDEIPSPPRQLLGSIASFLGRQKEAPGAMVKTAGNMVGTARTWVSQRFDGTATALSAPRTLLNGPLTPRRSVSLTKVDLDEVREIRRAFGTTVNDVVVAATGLSVLRYLARRGGVPVSPLVSAVPVSARDESSKGEMGNKVSTMMVGVPTVLDDPVALVTSVHEYAAASKQLQSALGPESLEQISGFVAPPLVTAATRLYMGMKLDRFHRPFFNFVVSNVPGPPIDLFCAGNRVSGIFPMGPLLLGSGLNVTVLSEAHHLNVGVMACTDLVTDVGEIGRGFVEAVAELLDLARAA